MEDDIKPIGKVYINIRKLIKDYNARSEVRLKKEDLACFVIRKGSKHARVVAFIRKTKEDSPYELNLSELYNLCLYLRITIVDFFENYTKVK